MNPASARTAVRRPTSISTATTSAYRASALAPMTNSQSMGDILQHPPSSPSEGSCHREGTGPAWSEDQTGGGGDQSQYGDRGGHDPEQRARADQGDEKDQQREHADDEERKANRRGHPDLLDRSEAARSSPPAHAISIGDRPPPPRRSSGLLVRALQAGLEGCVGDLFGHLP